MDTDKVIKELKEELTAIFNEKFADFPNEAKKDLKEFLQKSEEKLKRWTMLLAEGAITQDEFTWLVESQKDLMLFHALYFTGVSKIKIGHFKNKVIDTIINKILKIVIA